MPRYLVEVSYKPEGLQGLLAKGGTARREMIEKMLAEVGGKVESFDYAFGANDAYLIVDVPDHATVAAITMMVGATGTVACKTTVLLSPEEIDRAAAVKASYTPPGA
ncbi:MAG TPA: GYD domain-containing protein [Acidimicrobiales bacterium]|nr:GYD domain-containing protein [Acidimicrobiales bacterium]